MTAAARSNVSEAGLADSSPTARIAYQGKPLDAYTKKDLIALIALLISDYDLLEAELSQCRQSRDHARRASSHGFLRGRRPSV